MTEWILVERSLARQKTTLNTFITRSIKSSQLRMPEGFKNESLNVYVSKENSVVKIQISDDGRITVAENGTIFLPKIAKEVLNDDQVVLYATKNEVYLMPYSLGAEKLEEFLRNENVIR